MNLKRKSCCTILIVIACVLLCSCGTKQPNVTIKQYTQNVLEVLNGYGIEDATVTMPYEQTLSEYKLYNVAINSNSVEELSTKQIYNLLADINNLWNTDVGYLVSSSYIYSNENTYRVFEYELYKNDELIADFIDKDSMEFKVKVFDWIEDRYDYYDNKEGKYTGDKYTDTIFAEAAERFGITLARVDGIWFDSSVAQEAWK